MDPTDAAEAVRTAGYVILRDVLTPEQIAAVTAALAPWEAERPMGRTAFEGKSSKRVYGLAGKDPLLVETLAAHPAVLAVVEQLLMPNFLLSTFQSIRLMPGERAQATHTDDAFYLGVPRPRPMVLGVSVIWALEDFDEENGATQVIPGSHRWGAGESPEDHPDARLVSCVMRAGSCVMYDAALWHGGGANRTQSRTRLAVTPQYCQPWLRTQESQLLLAPPHVAVHLSPRARSLVGYSIAPPFLGQVDGQHPLRLVDAEFAALVLERPGTSFSSSSSDSSSSSSSDSSRTRRSTRTTPSTSSTRTSKM